MPNYLYNGIELPDINEVWTDKATYPYALIGQRNSDGVYFLYISKRLEGYVNVKNYTYYIPAISFDGKTATNYTIEDDGWTMSGNPDSNSYCFIGDKYSTVLWSSTDITTSTGGVWIEGSDPVPVGGDPETPEEPETPEPTLTERDLYKKINGQPTKLTLYKKVSGELVPLDEYTQGGNL